jgi:uncharacterized protein YndB with AHSA1/START domain
MTDTVTETRTVTIERELPFPAERVWRALTQPHLIAEWLMKNDFAPIVGRAFQFTADWGSVDGEVLEIEPLRSLAYSWNAMGLDSTVTWTLTSTAAGTLLRMDHAGFPRDHDQAYQGARWGWQKFFGALEELVAKLD